MTYLSARRLRPVPPAGFDCGREEQNTFLYEHAWKDQEAFLSTTYLFFTGRVLAAYATAFMDAVPLGSGERRGIRFRDVSALKLGQLGVSDRFQGQGFGRDVVNFVIELAYEIGERVASRYCTLDAHPEVVGWYEMQGFSKNLVRQEERMAVARRFGRDPDAIPVSMRFDVRDGWSG